MKIFLDVEFTDFKSPELISIGMVAESGECFYRELPFSIEKCSNFVCDTVLPLLSGAPSSVDAVAADLCVWLAQFDRPEILFDFAVDGKLFLDLYQWGGESVVMHLVQFDNQGGSWFRAGWMPILKATRKRFVIIHFVTHAHCGLCFLVCDGCWLVAGLTVTEDCPKV